MLLTFFRSDEKLELRYNLEGHALGVVSLDINKEGTSTNIWYIIRRVRTPHHIFTNKNVLLAIASSSLDSHIRLWDLDTGDQIKNIDAGPGNVV